VLKGLAMIRTMGIMSFADDFATDLHMLQPQRRADCSDIWFIKREEGGSRS